MLDIPMTVIRALKKFFGVALILSCNAGFANPDVVRAVPNFDITRCLGTWYEIARTDHLLEKNLDFTSAEFFVDRNGAISLSTRGLDSTTKKWKQVDAKVQGKPDSQDGELDLLFFGTITGRFTVLAVDDEYRHALLASRNSKQVWLLSREQTLSESIIDEYLGIAHSNRIKTGDLVRVVQKEK